MKKLFKPLAILSLLFTSLSLLGQNEKNKEPKRYEHFKERNITKTYPASGNSLRIENSFGSVKVSTWDKNEIKVDVHIEASSDNKEHAEKIFSKIDVEESKNGSKINFKTTHNDENKKDGCKNCKSNMMINYTIQMPASNTLSIENSFGSVELPDYSGSVSLNSQFGSLTAGHLSKAEELTVGFGSANIKSINNTSATFKFSSITVDNISGQMKLDFEFCNSAKIGLSNNLSSLTMIESYSTVNLRPAANLSADYTISTSFGSFKNKTSAEINRTDTPDRYGPDADKKYEGKSGSGGVKINVKSSFGTIILGEASAEEMSEKKKGKKTLS